MIVLGFVNCKKRTKLFYFAISTSQLIIKYNIYNFILFMDKREHQLLIDVKDLTWWYEDSPYLLFDKFNFALYAGDFTIVMWKSGCGKSSLVKLIIWQKKAPPKTIYHKREDISRYSDDEIQLFRRKIWIIFQVYGLLWVYYHK